MKPELLRVRPQFLTCVLKVSWPIGHDRPCPCLWLLFLAAPTHTLLLIILALSCTERYGAGRNPNHHCRPRAREDITSIHAVLLTHTHTRLPTITHTNTPVLAHIHTHTYVQSVAKILNADTCMASQRLGVTKAQAVSFHPRAHRQPASVGARE